MRIGIVDDDATLVESLRFLLANEPGVREVHCFTTGEELLRSGGLEQIDLLLVDMELPGLSGVELISLTAQRQPSLNCLAYTVSAHREVVFEAIKAGACGYILKGGGFRELIDAIHMIQHGGAPMSPAVARQVLREFQRTVAAAPPDSPRFCAGAAALSEREQEVLRHLCDGAAYKQIAGALSISTHTVNTHVKHIYEKLHVCSRQEAVSKARQRGLV
jgi:DNA-binding NarL/FixJ family response regulator